MPESKNFVKQLPEKFFIEVPYYPEWFVELIKRGTKSTRWHYQFFTVESFSELFRDIPCTIEHKKALIEKEYARRKEKGCFERIIFNTYTL